LPCVAVYCVRAESDHSPLFLAHIHAHTYTHSLSLSTIERHYIQTQTPVLAKRDKNNE
jgi:hypothetical protein